MLKFHLKIVLLFCILNSAFLITKAQVNLVPNPSFETYTTCPTNQAQISNAIGWDSYLNTPDYFNVCAPWPNAAGVPANGAGFQYPSQGNGYAGFMTRGLTQALEHREYIGCQLVSPLIINHKYDISYKVSLSVLDSTQGQICATNNLGVIFSTKSYSFSNPFGITNFSHINESFVITDTANWTMINGSFVADSAYSYMICGNFYDDANTLIQCYGDTSTYKFAYYYIDEISLVEDTSFHFGLSNFLKNDVEISPNPFYDAISIGAPLIENLKIFDVLGNCVYSTNEHYIQNLKLDLGFLPKGVYYMYLRIESNNKCEKIIKQ